MNIKQSTIMKRLFIPLLLLISTILSSCEVMQGIAMSMSGYGGYGSTYTSNGNIDYLLDPRYAIMQTQQQMNQLNAVSNAAAKQAAWQTEQDIREGKVDLSGSTNGSHSYSSTRSSTGSICRTCQSDGKCNGCHGSGYPDNSYGTGVDYKHKCGVCGGNGICVSCGGSGKR